LVRGRAPLSLFHFFGRRPLPASLFAKPLCPFFSLAHSQGLDPAITRHVRGPRKHKLGAKGRLLGANWSGRAKRASLTSSIPHGGEIRRAARLRPTRVPHCRSGGRRGEPPA